MYKVGFIGAGNMGYAMLKGMAKVMESNEITFCDVDDSKVARISKELNIRNKDSNYNLVKDCQYIVLAVKPQYYSTVIDEIKDVVTDHHVIISIAPGITIEGLKESLGKNVKIVRAMPNVPALVASGVTVIALSSDDYSDEEKATIEGLFASIGQHYFIKEKLMDAVVPVSGSSPAYIFMLIEALADGGVALGLPRDLSYELAAGAVKGSAELFLKSDKHPGVLKDMVCSPGGTTIEAVASLEKAGFRGDVIEAMKVCYDKTKMLKK